MACKNGLGVFLLMIVLFGLPMSLPNRLMRAEFLQLLRRTMSKADITSKNADLIRKIADILSKAGASEQETERDIDSER